MYPPIFIIGAPRSGSTLLYQAMLDYFDFGYLSNLHCFLYGYPALVERMVHPTQRRKGNYYVSEYGKTKGWSTPSECGDFWYRFFRRRPQFIPMAAVTEKNLTQLRSAVRSFGNSVKKPLLFKNLNCALRLEPTINALPEAVFLVIHRNELNNAQSILKGRKDIHGTYDQWLGVEPPDVEALKKLPCYQQVVLQIRHTHLLIDKARDKFGRAKFYDILYEEFCLHPYKIFKGIETFLSSHRLLYTQRGKIPSRFQLKTKVNIDEELFNKLREYIKGNTGNG